jgi:hypothetical protein
MKNYTKIKIYTFSFCFLVIILALIVQLKGQSFLSSGCSYLDPITIDLLAFGVAVFLLIEGVYRINEHKNMGVKKQLTRIIRIGIGCAIITLHVLQVLYK